ncbi:MAG: hypothetical protein ACRDN0_16160 [Trebonia sp.]
MAGRPGTAAARHRQPPDPAPAYPLFRSRAVSTANIAAALLFGLTGM